MALLPNQNLLSVHHLSDKFHLQSSGIRLAEYAETATITSLKKVSYFIIPIKQTTNTSSSDF
jgi:hypothetical protein